jgi:peroxiredoxin
MKSGGLNILPAEPCAMHARAPETRIRRSIPAQPQPITLAHPTRTRPPLELRMTFTLITILTTLLAMGDPNGRISDDGGAPLPTTDATPLVRRALETPATEVCLGDRAPNFSFQASDGRWRRLDDILAEGPVLLALGADELTLRGIEQERPRLLDLGVVPVAVVEYRSGVARSMTRRLGLGYTVLADPQGVIAAQFNAIHPATGRQLPAWFVMDRKRHVRGLGRRGLPLRGYAAIAANALGVPMANATVPSSR